MKRKIKLEKKAGIWLNQKEAHIIIIGDNEIPTIEKIDSGVGLQERFAGEKKPYTQFGATYVNEERRRQRRQKQQRERYFKRLIKAIKDADYIYLFGPGKAKEELNNKIEKDHTIHGKPIKIVTAGRLTKNQMIQQVREYYNSAMKIK